MAWFKALGWIWKLVLIGVAALFIFLAYNFIDDLFSKEDEVRAELSENQTEAAVASGVDTVTTINNQHTKETQRIETVRVIQNEVNNAQDTGAAHAAGATGLCVNYNICAEDPMQPVG